jgi:glycosyltransferase involved in cell wall biosynthesis
MDTREARDNLISVIIPCYNSEKYIAKAIESVLIQTYKNFELLVINDGSTDKSESIIKEYQNKDSRINYYSQSNEGVSAARNKGVKYSSGVIIAFLDSDDVWQQDNLEFKVKELSSGNDIQWVYSDAFVTDENLNRTGVIKGGSDKGILNSLLANTGDIIQAPSNIVLWKSCILNSGIQFDTNLSISADWDFCIQLAANNFNGKRIPFPLWSYRVLDNSMSTNIKKLEKDYLFVIKKAHRKKLFKSFWFKQKCFSNTYLVLAGCLWKDEKSIFKGLFYIVKSVLYFPPNILKVLSKIKLKSLNQEKNY